MTAGIVRADALMLPIADESVDLIITSPPYFALRSYQDGGEHYDGQIGSEPTPQDFIEALWAVTKECWRVLKPTGSMFLNLGDKYSGSGGHNNSGVGGDGRGPTSYNKASGGARPKSLMGLPWRYALGCVDGMADPDGIGWILRAEIVWSKPNGMPESVTDRVRRSHETWFHLTKHGDYFASLDELREPPSGYFRENQTGSTPEGRAPSGMLRAVNPSGRLPGSVWTIATEPLQVPDDLGIDHFAAFPTEWSRRLIAGWVPTGICSACGDGRCPVMERTPMVVAPSARRIVAQSSGNANRTATGGTMIEAPTAKLIGYACRCTPYVDHPATAPGTTTKQGRGAGPTDPRQSYEGTLGNRPKVGPWREYILEGWTPPPTMPGVVLDPFGGTGTVAMVASALGRVGVSVDLSADYCRLAKWRCHESDHDLKAVARTYGEAQAESLRSQREADRAGQTTMFDNA